MLIRMISKLLKLKVMIALIALLNGDVDAVATYQDARADLKQDYPKYIKTLK